MRNHKSPITSILHYAFFAIFFLQSFTAFSQGSAMEPAKLKAVYTLEWQEDSLNPYHIREERFVLLLGMQHSIFKSYRAYYLASVARVNPNITIQEFQQRNPPRAAHLFHINKNFLNQQITTFDRVFLDNFVYTIPKDKIQWELTEETGEILGYSVQKATTKFGGRTWEAWFTHEIPHGDGPYKFSGLPGLILKIQDTRKHFVFEIESISPSTETIYMRRKSSAIGTTKAQFIEAQAKFRRDAINIILSSNRPLHESFHRDTERIEENLRRRNNPILLRAE